MPTPKRKDWYTALANPCGAIISCVAASSSISKLTAVRPAFQVNTKCGVEPLDDFVRDGFETLWNAIAEKTLWIQPVVGRMNFATSWGGTH